MNDAARRAPRLHRGVHGATALVALTVATVGLATPIVGSWLTTVATVAAVLLAAEAVTCRCLVEDAVAPVLARVTGGTER